MVDAHCHLDLYPNPLEVANELERLGIYTIAVTNLPSHFIQGRAHLHSYKKVRLAIGMHPLYAERHTVREFDLFKEHFTQTSYIGEIGLDFSKEGIATKDAQIRSFEFVLQQIEGKPKLLSLHSRGAEQSVLNYLLQFNVKTAIFHWYSGPVQLIGKIVKAGYMFSVNSAMTNSKKGMEIISKIPISNILTETDGPFIQYKGRILRPSDLSIVENSLSKIYRIPIPIIKNAIEENFKSLIMTIKI